MGYAIVLIVLGVITILCAKNVIKKAKDELNGKCIGCGADCKAYRHLEEFQKKMRARSLERKSDGQDT